MSNYHSRNMSLCILCQNYCGKCNWSKYFERVEGWTAIEDYKNGKLHRAWVGWCPKFRADVGLYDLIAKGEERTGRWHIIKQYGYINELRYKTIRYRLVNDYERTKDDDIKPQVRQVNAEVKRELFDTLSQTMGMHR